ncbi:MAG: MTH938/NDUFAF3 family protein [Thermoplasmatales archaeon]|nr:MTH938/NDUFAF3 family protein [Thermoplasmatales archaeon]
MNIDSTGFGSIIIDGKKYSDVLIVNNKILERDWGSGSHGISSGEAEKLLMGNPDIIIVGTGQAGVLRVDNNIIKKFSRNAELFVLKTPEAVKRFNELSNDKKVNALIHTTC